MAQPIERNRLDGAASPYLEQHADNPVNWQPWDDAALAAARERDRPIFLSIGYSSCHWCHVMAEESFEDPAVAERLNEHFVPIKVDREERPDLDSIYMTVCRQVTQGGCGWPLSVWLTPELRPFYVGTYFPPTANHGRPGFGELLDSIVEAWETDRSELEERGEAWLGSASEVLESVSVPASESTGEWALETAGERLVEMADRSHGGFGVEQKFPHVERLLVLASLAERGASGTFQAVLEEALDAMAAGGIRDHVGGGFHRYCVDRDWTVPHFEKMLYDNAAIPRAFLAGAQVTGREGYAEVAAETFAFVERELTHPEGGFYSTLDARSPPREDTGATASAVEGAFYTWTPGGVREAMATAEGADAEFDTDQLANVFEARFGVTKAGNFEGETVLTRARSVREVAAAVDMEPKAVEGALTAARRRARAARAERPRPPRDEKILADWNGLMIGALAQGTLVLGEPRYAEMGREALAFLQEHHWDGDRLAHRYKDGDRQSTDYLADYAFVARGALELHGVTGELGPLAFALDLGRAIERRFWDAEASRLYFTADGAQDLPMRPSSVDEGSTPSSTGVAVEVLAALDHVDPTAGFDEIAETVLAANRDRIESSPERHPTLAMAADLLETGHLEVTVAAESVPEDWQDLLAASYRPDLLLTRRPPTDGGLEDWLDALSLESAPPLWEGRAARERPTAYVCRRQCSPPVTDGDGLDEWLAELG